MSGDLIPEEAMRAAHAQYLGNNAGVERAVRAAAPLILAAELERMADELDATGVVFRSAAHALRTGKDGVTVQSADLSAEGRGLDRAVAELRLRASVLRGEGQTK